MFVSQVYNSLQGLSPGLGIHRDLVVIIDLSTELMDKGTNHITEVGNGCTRMDHPPLINRSIVIQVFGGPLAELDEFVPGPWRLGPSELLEQIRPIIHHHNHVSAMGAVILPFVLELGVDARRVVGDGFLHNVIEWLQPSRRRPVLNPSFVGSHQIDARIP